MRAIQVAVITGLILGTILLAGCTSNIGKPVTLHTYIPDRAYVQQSMAHCRSLGHTLLGARLVMRYSCEKPGEI